jgi:hypothetical protein
LGNGDCPWPIGVGGTALEASAHRNTKHQAAISTDERNVKDVLPGLLSHRMIPGAHVDFQSRAWLPRALDARSERQTCLQMGSRDMHDLSGLLSPATCAGQMHSLTLRAGVLGRQVEQRERVGAQNTRGSPFFVSGE